jgi:hypothetical protein
LPFKCNLQRYTAEHMREDGSLLDEVGAIHVKSSGPIA